MLSNCAAPPLPPPGYLLPAVCFRSSRGARAGSAFGFGSSFLAGYLHRLAATEISTIDAVAVIATPPATNGRLLSLPLAKGSRPVGLAGQTKLLATETLLQLRPQSTARRGHKTVQENARGAGARREAGTKAGEGQGSRLTSNACCCHADSLCQTRAAATRTVSVQ